MQLSDWIASHDESQRAAVRSRLAEAHEVSEITIRSWANGNRQHPGTLKAVEITERETNGQVTRHDVRPDVYGDRAA